MTSISDSAAYSRKRPHLTELSDDSSLADSHSALERKRRVWHLLETPQTIDSVCRTLANERLIDPHCHATVRELFAQMLEENLIELSPDS